MNGNTKQDGERPESNSPAQQVFRRGSSPPISERGDDPGQRPTGGLHSASPPTENAGQPQQGIRIVRMNTDKTRRIEGSTDVYNVYLELSGVPPLEWPEAFARQWDVLAPKGGAGPDVVGVQGGFLVVRSRLEDLASQQLPLLTRAVAAANEEYSKRRDLQAHAQSRREEVWKEERTVVEDVARSLHFP